MNHPHFVGRNTFFSDDGLAKVSGGYRLAQGHSEAEAGLG